METEAIQHQIPNVLDSPNLLKTEHIHWTLGLHNSKVYHIFEHFLKLKFISYEIKKLFEKYRTIFTPHIRIKIEKQLWYPTEGC